MTRAILGFGAYVPRRRLQRSAIFAAHGWYTPGLKGSAKGEKAIGNWDEDSVTMAVEAARDVLGEAGGAQVEALTLASTTLPSADRLNAGIVKEALSLADAVAAADAGGSLRAGTSALLAALEGRTTRLVLAADRRVAKPGSEAEMTLGDGAAAVLVGDGDGIARFLGGHSVTVDFVDHFRSAQAEFDYGWESRWIRDEGYAGILGGAIREALAKHGIETGSIDRALIAVPVRGVPESLAKAAKIRPEAVADTLTGNIGDTGTAHPLLMLAAALEAAKPGERILLASFGQGADVLIFETSAAIADWKPRRGLARHLADGRADNNYMRYLYHRGLVTIEEGMRAEMDQKQPGTTLYRNRKAVLGLIGGRCTKTGTVQFPKSDISVNPNDRAIGTQEDYPLSHRTARIVTYTADALGYSPDPPNYYGAIDFEGGGRLVAEFADVEAADVEVGRAMRMVFRIKAVDSARDFTKYFWKAVPADSTGQAGDQ